MWSHNVNAKTAKALGMNVCPCGCGNHLDSVAKKMGFYRIDYGLDEDGYIPLHILNDPLYGDIFTPPDFILGEENEKTRNVKYEINAQLGNVVRDKLEKMTKKINSDHSKISDFKYKRGYGNDDEFNLQQGKYYRLQKHSYFTKAIPTIFIKRTPKYITLIIEGKEKRFQIKNDGYRNGGYFKYKGDEYYNRDFHTLDYIRASNTIKKAFLKWKMRS